MAQREGDRAATLKCRRAIPSLAAVVVALGASACSHGPPAAAQDGGAAAPTAPTTVSLTFDDSFSDTFQAGAMLEAHGMRGTFYVNAPRLAKGPPEYMTAGEARVLQSHGHVVGGHTLDHPHLPTLSPDAQAYEICDDRAQLLALGLDVRHFAYPFGEASADTESAARACNYASARGVGDLHGAIAEDLTPLDMFRMRAGPSIVTTNTLEDMQARVLAAESGGGGWVIINMHHVCDTCGTNQVHPDVLAAFLDWLEPRAAHGTVVRTIHDVVGGELLPAVTRAVPDAGAPDANVDAAE
jgi:peptidoglycan/xylan/chitin deacetylase (PgdA/CDA1 family)